MNVELFERYAWWAALNHGGLLIAPSKLAESFPAELPPLDRGTADRLRRAILRVEADGEHGSGALLDVVLEDLLGLEASQWRKGSAVDASWSRRAVTGEVIRPARLWLGAHGALLPVFYPDASSGGLKGGAGTRLGVGRGRRIVSRVIEWLRKSDLRLALITTGRQLRLVHAGPDYDAFCEWDIALWFQEGAPSLQVTALRALLSPDALVPTADGKPCRLLAAVQGSRQGQAELSQALGERVRQAVELLIGESSDALASIDAEGQPASSRPSNALADQHRVSRRDIYIAATRLVMRCVVILFAEARELLPRSNEIYESSYGLQGLRAQLDRMSGGRAAERLRTSHSAWPRLLSLFRLVFDGSAHPSIPVPRYAGGLFQPGSATSGDPIRRALAAFESAQNAPNDAVIHRVLELLCRTKVKVRQGRGARVVEAPVDFSDLSSEYIGILYEGLLDFELRRVAEDDVVVFLNLGDQPALPFQRLNDMNNEELAELLSKLKKSKKEQASDDDDADDVEADNSDDEEAPEDQRAADGGDVHEATAELGTGDDRTPVLRQYVQDWAERAVKAAKLVRYPRNDSDVRVRAQFARDVSTRARDLVQRIVLPGSWFLVRWGGTRKGSGTFYTRPQIAGPTVRRALQPLCFEAVSGTTNDLQARVPRRPEEILALKVCDPAMGSGSFLVSALRYLTDALYESLHHHGRLESRSDGTVCRLADGAMASNIGHELLPVPPDHPDFEDRLRARLKRHVVERCVYGVDLDPLAVELARASLWVETMDRELPFGFLDHKLKCGNSLVGCWFDRFQEYPILAWEREGGDKDHEPVHHFREIVVSRGKSKGQTKRTGDKWTAAIKKTRDEVIKPELVSWLSQRAAAASGQKVADFAVEGRSADDLHLDALQIFDELHSIVPISDADRRAEVYAEKILGSPALQRLRLALDTWCAIWFWPAEDLSDAPKPSDFLAPGPATLWRVKRIAAEHRFFHWELDFPDVFRSEGSGFDATIGNPPWDTLQPESLEFFSNLDPLYRTYTREQAIQRRRSLFADDPRSEEGWIDYCAKSKAMSNWIDNVANPFERQEDVDGRAQRTRGRADAHLASFWKERRQARRRYIGQARPFVLQEGGKVYTYRLFTECAHVLLGDGGHLGLLLPSGIYTDSGSQTLRELFLDRCRWTHLYAFQNERFVFDGIHHSFKMAVIHIQKGGKTNALLTRFRLGPGDSPEAQEIEDDLLADPSYLEVPVERIRRFSPKTLSVLELRNARDLAMLEKLYGGAVLLGDDTQDGWCIEYRQGDFNMTSDSKLFPPKPKWEEQGYKPDEYGHWLKGKWTACNGTRALKDLVRSADGAEVIAVGEIEDVALPLYQGIMVQQFEFAPKRWLSGTGLRAKWEVIPPLPRRIPGPQFLMARNSYIGSDTSVRGLKVGFRDIARNTDERTTIGSLVPDMPCGNVLGILSARRHGAELLLAVLNSFAFDAVARVRVTGAHLNLHIAEELPLLRRFGSEAVAGALRRVVLRIAGAANCFAPAWLAIAHPMEQRSWRALWAVSSSERVRLRAILDAAIAELCGLSADDLAWILRDCDHPIEKVCDKPFSRTLAPNGFWRVDKEMQPELRHTVLTLVAFQELKRVGLEHFLALNDGDGWLLPETLRLADYGLGHDARAKEHQPVAAALGPRLFPWQLEQGVEESWDECRHHAALIEKILPYPRAAADAPVTKVAMSRSEPTSGAAPGAVSRQTDLFGHPFERDLFGNPVQPRKRRKKA